MSFEVIQLICAFIGALGFSLLFNARLIRILPSALGGLLCWGVYLLSMHFNLGLFFASLVASMISSVYSEVLARVLKAPTTVFLIPSLIPLLPGSSLFYTMQYAVLNDWAQCRTFALETVMYIAAISLGISIISALFSIFSKKR